MTNSSNQNIGITTSILQELGIEKSQGEVTLPFKLISQPFIYRWLDHRKNVWIYGIPISCSIDEKITPNNKYHIKFKHGKYEWDVNRSLVEFKLLNFQLYRHKFKKKLSFSDYSVGLKQLPSYVLSYFTNKLENYKIVEDYLNKILRCPELKNISYTLEFCNVSYISFKTEYGVDKGREEKCHKRPGGYYGLKLKNTLTYWILGWQSRLLIQKGTFMAYVNTSKQRLGGVILLDEHLRADLPSKKDHLIVTNRTRIFTLKFSNYEKPREWFQSIINSSQKFQNINTNVGGTDDRLAKAHNSNESNNSNSTGTRDVSNQQSVNGNNSTVDSANESETKNLDIGENYGNIRFEHRYDSFAPIRQNSYGNWFVDGSGYFEAVADALYSAKKEIFICDWWLSPKLYLKRPLNAQSDKWRFDNILKSKAEQGVKIYILLYKEIPLALGLNSEYTENTLNDIHPYNIHILRHPDHLLAGVFLWSHHEKIVCIDQTIAFIGGLDICYGRWDDQIHRLTDIPKANLEDGSSFMENKPNYDDLIDPENILKERKKCANAKSNPKVLDAGNENSWIAPVKKFIFRRTQNSYEITPAPKSVDLESNLVLNENDNLMNRRLIDKTFLNAETSGSPSNGTDERTMFESNVRHPRPNVQTLRHDYKDKNDIQKLDLVGTGKYWIGKDYSNFIYKDFAQVDEPFTDLIDRNKIPRMPWHDIASVTYGVPARDISRHFIERWNQTVVEKRKKDADFPLLLPWDYGEVMVNIPDFVQQFLVELDEVQICRSCTTWSSGIKDTELSIQSAYIDLIKNAKDYIYIENQFFVSNHGTNNVTNKIANALYERIIKAHEKNEQFKVYIVMPLLPGFEGQIGEKTGAFLQAMIYWINCTLSYGPESLFGRLKQKVEDPKEYIGIFGLRKYGKLQNNLVTELVYVHSKLMIIDDEISLIGSANVNDRSLSGERDSEVAIIYKDKPPYSFSMQLRKSLFKEHLFGSHMDMSPLTGDNITQGQEIVNKNPGSDEVFEQWKLRSTQNTQIFDEVFKCVPPPNTRTLDALRKYKLDNDITFAESDPSRALNRLRDGIRGRIVNYPLDFLVDEGEKLLKLPQSDLKMPHGNNSVINILYT